MREEPSTQTNTRLRAKVPVTWREKGMSNAHDWATFHNHASNVQMKHERAQCMQARMHKGMSNAHDCATFHNHASNEQMKHERAQCMQARMHTKM